MQSRPDSSEPVEMLRAAPSHSESPAGVWQAIAEIYNDFTRVCLDVVRAVANVLYKVAIFGSDCINSVWVHALKPVLSTLFDVGLYFLKRIAFGSPCLWPYLRDGIFSSDTADGSDRIRSNLWGVMDNVLGLLGGAIGVLNFLNHMTSSYCKLVYNYCHLLGNNGAFGKQDAIEDKRHIAVKLGFGLLASPFVIPTVILTNVTDACLTFCANFAQSMTGNLLPIRNLLGSYGVFGKRDEWKDERSWLAIIVYGALSAPLVAMTAAITNTADFALTFMKHAFLSYGRNIRSTFNLLGKHGALGEHIPYNDDRHFLVKGLFGLVSFPFVLSTALLTNTVDAVLTLAINIKKLFNGYLRAFVADFFSNVMQSFVRNLHPIYNLLGKTGTLGERHAYSDDRPLAARIFYGILSAPFVGTFAAISNSFDAALSIVKHFFLSWKRNTDPLTNILLGKHGVFGDRRAWKDDRSWFGIITFGLASAPLVLLTAAFTNICDVVFSSVVPSFESWLYNTRPFFNILLGKHGQFGERRLSQIHDDTRDWKVRLGFGLLTLPFVATTVAITNTYDCLHTIIKNMLLSFGNNLAPISHILGEKGVMGSTKPYHDERRLLTRIVYGLLTAPAVLLSAISLNLIDFVGAYFKNYKYTITRPTLLLTGLTIGAVTAVPAFVLRKTLKGLYDFTIGPISNYQNNNPNHVGHILKGAANFFTLGFFSVCRKIFKACTGYSSRFGYPSHHDGDGEPDTFEASQDRFKEAIDLAIHGKFPGVADKRSHFRVVMHLFYGLRHEVEDIIKTMHDVYLSYARDLENMHIPHSDTRYGAATFFSSSHYNNAKSRIADATMRDQVENYFQPSPSF